MGAYCNQVESIRHASVAPVLCAFALMLFSGASAARDALYWASGEGSLVAADYRSLDRSRFDPPANGSVEGVRTNLAAQWAGGGAWVLAIGHEYNALDIDAPPPASPQTNGDLHTFHGAVAWRTELPAGRLRLALATAVSASSNAFKHPDHLDGNALQLWGAAGYALPAKTGEWVVGAAYDHRFGAARGYPVVGWQWQGDATRVRLVYPDLLLQRQFGTRWTLGLITSPDGNEWQAYDRDLGHHDDFRREAWQSELRLTRSLGRHLGVAVSAGYLWHQHWQFASVDGRTGRVDSEDSYYLGLHLGWHFDTGEQRAWTSATP